MKTLLHRLLCACVALLALGAATSLAQHAMEKPLEEVGVITAISTATSTITVDGRTLRVTTATRVTADDPKLRYSPVSQTWLGRQVAMETDVAADGTAVVRLLHIFDDAGQ